MTAANETFLSDSSGLSREGLRARIAALDIMEDILRRRRDLDAAMENNSVFNSLSRRERAFARMLVATVLRRQGQLDDLIRRAEERPGTSRSSLLQNILRLGAAQICFMEVPGHAAIDTSVTITEQSGFSRQKNFVNAVLRTITRMGGEWLERQDPARMNIPEWLMRIWIEDYGLRRAAEISLASQAEPPVDISVKNAGMLEYWAGELEATVLPTGSLRRHSGGLVSSLPGFEDGMWWIQDAGAALPVKLLGDINGKKVVDLCAAPGGKTAQLASLGANVIAVDRSVKRIERLNNNIQRLRLEAKIKTEVADATVWQPDEQVSFVILDAPCTATGTIRRNPDILHIKEKRDIESLAALQFSLLQNAIKMLAPGGILIYCTCSLQKAEGEYQVERHLSGGAPLTRLPVGAHEIGGIEDAVIPEGDIRLLPYHLSAHGGIDGFFISRLIKE
jgi:16S rRNA (cytosine967-C5)-methyltransferase